MRNTVTDEPINNTYNACIIGCGSIGALKDDKFDSPLTSEVLTIAHAFTAHPNIKLVGVVDTCSEKADRAAKKWNTTPYTLISDVKEDIDLVAVCVPTEYHESIMLQVLDLKPKLVMCEKPFCDNSEQAQYVLDMYKERGIPIQIDYIRRFSNLYQVLKADIQSGGIEKIYHTKLTYTRGIFHEACHFLDLCGFWFGDFEHGEIYSGHEPIIDRDPDDQTHAVVLSFDKCDAVFMCPVDGRDFGVFEIDIMTDIGRFVFSQNGTYLDFYPVVPEPVYGDYNSLSNKFGRKDTRLTTALMDMTHNCVQHMNGTHDLVSPGADAIKTHEAYESLKRNM